MVLSAIICANLRQTFVRSVSSVFISGEVSPSKSATIRVYPR